MNKWLQRIVLPAVLALAIPFSAYADNAAPAQTVDPADKGAKAQEERGCHGDCKKKFRMRWIASPELLGVLKLDEKTLFEKMKSGKTLAEIAKEQGVSRDVLKKTLLESHRKHMQERMAKFEQNIDNMIDMKPHIREPKR
ncbi:MULTISPECIES: hypothetical protein [unclassified Paenibacillus]|uniref:hypothetical protein n=1 Tax=unclassified Paenibacillus TaxID=185978 RepID=UPI001C0F6510|nr:MULTISPECIES: hypothetical protein [unclassified Paenibacillus]MBU5440716.1 hypothetical protein [Paenibacillus sp. MSJ-34]CAH0120430.1 hypothetical protein PAE9249_02949 [Paenibacillus sp. CECT 9249]